MCSSRLNEVRLVSILKKARSCNLSNINRCLLSFRRRHSFNMTSLKLLSVVTTAAIMRLILCAGRRIVKGVVGCPQRFCHLLNMEKEGVVPDVVKVVPKEVAEIKYGNVIVSMGNELTPTQVKNKPTSIKWEADSNSYYTLCMTDPDAPSRKEPKFREWHHWLVVNIPGNDITKGETLSEYIGSGPPKDTGLHRYVYLVYKQNDKIGTGNMKKLTNKSGDHRGKFSIQKFAEEHKLGDPIAGNFFQAKYDDYVPILYKQLSGK